MASTSQQDPDLGYQSPIFSLLLSDLESNNNFASMSMDDLFNHIYGDTDAFTLATDDGGAGTTGGASFCRSFSLQKYKTVDEVWKEITDRRSTGTVTDEAGDIGEITLEEFLTRAGVEEERTVKKIPIRAGVEEAGLLGAKNLEEFLVMAGIVSEDVGYRKDWMMDVAQFQSRKPKLNEREEVQNKVTSETVIEDGSNYEISLSLKDLKQHFGKKLDDAVKSLGVSRSTVKRACRSHGIKRWPFPKRTKVNHHPLSNPKQAAAAAAAAAAQTIQDVTKAQDFETVKAKYRDTVIKFQLSLSSGIAELVENVTKRLPLTSGSFSMRYEDDEGDLVLIGCDEDLNDCLVGWLSLPDKKPIRMFIDDESIINQAP